MNIFLVVGTRPQIIKSSKIIQLANQTKNVTLDVIHTGQHYDYEMTKIFFDQLNLSEPLVNLDVTGSPLNQIGEILLRFEDLLRMYSPDFVLVPGDTNSALGGSLSAVKLNIPVAHIEAGARSFDKSMPEEVNRVITDHISKTLFTATDHCTQNLLAEGILGRNIFQVGDTMFDVLLENLPYVADSKVLDSLDLEPKSYILLTTHRQENVDKLDNLRNIVDAMFHLKPLKIVFSVHPRTLKQLRKHRFYYKLQRQSHIRLIAPMGYHESLNLIKNARVLLTDSGGMQKEAFWLKTPCVTLRDNTEWIETVQNEVNFLTGANTKRILRTVDILLKPKCEARMKERFNNISNPFGDGYASQQIVQTLKDYVDSRAHFKK